MLNNIVIEGRLTKQPEVRHTQAGKAVASFSIACDRDFKDSNGKKATDFFDVVVWGATGERCGEWLYKGYKVTLVGRLQTRDWTDREGNKRKSFEIVAREVHFPPRQQASEPREPEFEDVTDDDGELLF